MEKTFQPQQIEAHWAKEWEKQGYFKPSGKGPSYCIMIPPPNVTGTLHMGHAFQYSLMDALIRYHRMCGFNTLWQVGIDHAGIATQILVERQLQQQNTSRHELGREKFIEAVHRWKEHSGGIITQQMRRLGVSVDWERERFTLDEGLSQAVQEVFIRLYQEGLIYRGECLVNWDPKLKTAISDLEVISQEEDSQLYDIRYPLIDGSGYLIVSTTRPETLFGDMAVAVHPDDKRYQHLIGKQAKLPFTERVIPIIADEFVMADFGTGCVKITPAHDFRDYEVGKRHNLPLMNILNPDATLNDQVPPAFRGLDRWTARKKAIDELTQQGLIEKISTYKNKIPRGDRSGEVIEPYLTYQWFVQVKPLAKAAIKAVQTGEIKFVPENWINTYNQWMYNIQDWCISRQLWWGHRIPAWYDEQQNIYVGHNEADVRQRYQLSEQVKLTQDEDVLDTWFSSALWPFSTLGWPEKTTELSTFYPTQVLVTGFDIIFFWVARMIMMGLKFTKQVPFQTVYITGLIRDHEGQKMSKSKGNILDPIDLIDGIDLESLVQKRTQNLLQPTMAEKITQSTRKQFPEGIPAFGTDALRFTFCALATYGRDIRFDLNRIEGYRNFCNKLWNAARFVLMHCENQTLNTSITTENFSVADRYIRSRLQQVIEEAHRYFSQYRFDLLAKTLYEFVWNEYCDWYLEFAKVDLQNPETTEQKKLATRFTLLEVLDQVLRLLHPLIPFITEEIWQQINPSRNCQEKSLMLAAFPQAQIDLRNENIEQEIEWLKTIIVGLRTLRAEKNIAPNIKIPVLVLLAAKQHNMKAQFERYQRWILNLAKVSKLEYGDENQTMNMQQTAVIFAADIKFVVPMAEFIDVAAEIQRLKKEIDKLQLTIDRAEQKLKNPDYIQKAPEDVVAKEQEKLSQAQLTIIKLKEQLHALQTTRM